jgi:hypothetical protein
LRLRTLAEALKCNGERAIRQIHNAQLIGSNPIAGSRFFQGFLDATLGEVLFEEPLDLLD